MAFVSGFTPSAFTFAPAEWLPIQDRELLDRIAGMEIGDHQGKVYENPEFEVQVVFDVHNYYATDLYQRIRLSDAKDEKLVLLLSSPENAVFISVVENLNKFRVSCRNVHVFFVNEYANEKGEVAPWQSPYSKSGHFMRYFYERLDAELRMPMEQIHFWTKENTETYSELLAAEGGADAAYTSLSWSGGIGVIDAETFPAKTMEEFLSMGSRFVTPMMETLAFDSLRGMFGCSGDIGNVPPCAVTVGPKDLAAAKYRMDMEFLSACGGTPSLQKYPLKLSLFGPAEPYNPGAMMRLYPGTCFVSAEVAAPGVYRDDNNWLAEKLDEIRKQEEV